MAKCTASSRVSFGDSKCAEGKAYDFTTEIIKATKEEIKKRWYLRIKPSK